MRLGNLSPGWVKACITACVLSGIVFAAFVAGTIYSLVSPTYHLENGELAADFAVLLGSLLLAVSTGYLAWLNRSNAGRTPRALLSAWLPAPNPHDGNDDLEAETRRVGRLGGRTLVIAVLLWLAIPAGALYGLTTLGVSTDRLLHDGTRVQGEVLSTRTPASGRGTPSMEVSYRVNGEVRTAGVDRDSGRQYFVGEPVTVIYDPADPSHVRTPDESNEGEFSIGFNVVLLFVALFTVPFVPRAATTWRRRARAVRYTGWRPAEVTVVPAASVLLRPNLHVSYGDGSSIVLRPVPSTHGSARFKNEPDHPAWIAGTDDEMVVLFAPDSRRQHHHAVPARALSLRETRRPHTKKARRAKHHGA